MIIGGKTKEREKRKKEIKIEEETSEIEKE